MDSCPRRTAALGPVAKGRQLFMSDQRRGTRGKSREQKGRIPGKTGEIIAARGGLMGAGKRFKRDEQKTKKRKAVKISS